MKVIKDKIEINHKVIKDAIYYYAVNHIPTAEKADSIDINLIIGDKYGKIKAELEVNNEKN